MEEVEILNIDTTKSQKSIKDLRTEIKELKSQLLSLEEGTAEYNKVLLEVGDKTHELKEIQEQTNMTTTDFGDRLSNTSAVLAGLSGMVEVVTGALAMMGVEMKDDSKLMKVLIGAMAMTSGIAAVDTGVKAFKALTISIKASTAAMSGMKKALIGTGIGAAVVAVGALVVALDNLRKKNEEAAEAQRQQNEALRDYLDLTQAVERSTTDYYSKQYNQMAIVQAYQKKLQKDEEFYRNKARQGLISDYEATKSIEADKLQYRKNIIANLETLNQQMLSHQSDAEWKFTEEGRAVWQKYFDARLLAAYDNAEQQKALMLELEEYNKQSAERTKKTTATPTTDNGPQPVSGISSPANAGVAGRTSVYDDTAFLQRERDIIIEQHENETELLLQLDLERNAARQQVLHDNLEAGVITESEYNQQMAQLDLEAANLEVALEKDKQERLTNEQQQGLDEREKKYQQYSQAIQTITDSVSNILGSIGSVLEQGSTEWKAVMIAQATIDTIAGGISAYMGMVKAIPGPWGIAAGAAAAASTVAAGMAEVKKIADTQISKSASSTPATSTSALATLSTPVTTTRQVQTQSDIEQLQDTRVYVLQSDIERAHNDRRVTVSNATF